MINKFYLSKKDLNKNEEHLTIVNNKIYLKDLQHFSAFTVIIKQSIFIHFSNRFNVISIELTQMTLRIAAKFGFLIFRKVSIVTRVSFF